MSAKPEDKPSVSTVDVAALLGAIDGEGKIDPVAFEAQRLVLRHETIDGAHIERLVEDARKCPLYQSAPDALIEAIKQRLPSQSALLFASAIGTNDHGEQPGFAKRLGKAVARFFRRQHRPSKRIVDEMAPRFSKLGPQPEVRRFLRRRVSEALKTVSKRIDLDCLKDEFVRSQHVRDMMIGAVTMYCAKAADEAKVSGLSGRFPICFAALIRLLEWKSSLEQSKQDGTSEAFLDDNRDFAVELTIITMPEAMLPKFARMLAAVLNTPAKFDDPAFLEIIGMAGKTLSERDWIAGQGEHM